MAKKLDIVKRNFSRSPWWAAFLSGFVAPGVGQIYNGDFKKGWFLLLTSIGAFTWFMRIVQQQLSLALPGTPDQWQQNQEMLRKAIMELVTNNQDVFLTFQILIVVVWSFGVIDAFLTARGLRKNRSSANEKDSDSVR